MMKLSARIGTIALCALCIANCRAQVSASTALRTVSGVVVSAKSGAPLAEAEVSLAGSRDRKPVAATTTDADGRFLFPNLPNGKFGLSASCRGYVAAAYQEHTGGINTAIVTGEGLVSNGLRLELRPQSAIYGTIAEDSGDPVPNARISLYRKDPYGGNGKMMRATIAMADPMGNFEFSDLAPGTYYACAFGSPWYTSRGGGMNIDNLDSVARSHAAALDVAYAATCYPDGTDSSGAEPIVLAPGERLPLSLVMHPEPAVHMRLESAEWQNKHQPEIPQLTTNIFGIPESASQSVAFSFPTPSVDGRSPGPPAVEITGLASGHYDMEFGAQNGENAREISVDAAAGSSTIDLSAATRLATLSGKAAMANGSGLPSSSFVSLQGREGQGNHPAVIAADGSFTSDKLQPGSYDVTAFAPPAQLSIVSLRAKGATVQGHALKVGSEPVDLAISLTTASAAINCVVSHDQKPAPGVFALLVPADLHAGRSAWQPNQSDSDGTVNFLRVQPGDYTVVAIVDGWDLDWSRPEVIRPFLAGGQRVTVGPSAREVNLATMVEAQPVKPSPANASFAASPVEQQVAPK